MASSSSANSSTQSPKKYDVFISFRGEDTRFNFTSHLHDALRRNHLDTYIDYRLEKGDEVWPSLERAIEVSTLFLVIFSENYASSTWCLKELTKIFDCSKNQDHLVIPVFYRVDPSHLRKQSGSYQKAFEDHENKGINKHQLQIWREALTHAANLAGWNCSLDRNEAQLIKEIMNCVATKLGPKYQSEDYLKDLIGIHKRMAYVESLFDNGSNNVQSIAIWGMGGIGKTTLAKALFHKLRFAYEGLCFLANVREESKKYGIDSLREKLILKLLQDRESPIGMLDAIYPYAMSRLGQKKVFIVLDDVDDVEQLKILAKRHEFGSGSKVLITTRDKQVLGNEVDDIYVLEGLNPDEAFDLFSINAFRNDYVDPKIRKLVVQVTQYASGNPLALKVLGSLLHGKNQVAWESQLDKLQKLPCPKINDILKMSLEGLDYEEKNIFLDIAFFFNYSYKEDVIKLLDACGYSTIIGLKSLEDKALLDIHHGMIYMHHLIKEMGRQTVREESLNDPKRRSRLWNSNEISEILKENKGSETIEGITLNLSKVEDMCLSPQAFCSLPNLKFLDFHKNFDDAEVRNKLQFPCGIEFLPDKLRLLRWQEFPLKSLPTTFKAEHLVEMIMPYSNLTKFWDGVQNLVNLRKIDLSGSNDLTELPDFSKAIRLSTVNVRACSKLQSVHPSILSLHSLHHLYLCGCETLTSLTSNTHLKSLLYLNLDACSKRNKFSVTSENCEFLLDLSRTPINNDELCSSSGYVSKLDSLYLNECESMKSLPYKLTDLRNLRCLHANRCNKLVPNLRSIFDEMRTLEVLELGNCSELFELPDNISLLSSLWLLYIRGTNIETLPLSIKHLSSLQYLYLDGCKRLRSLPELPPSISYMTTVSCLSLGTLDFLLTNEGEEVKHIYRDYGPRQVARFSFMNCMKLDQQSIKAATAKLVLGIHKGIYRIFYMLYPGKIVPNWFVYRTTQNVVTIDLNSIPQPWDGSFIFCVVLSKSPPKTDISVTWFIDGDEYCCPTEFYVFQTLESVWSDHVILWNAQNSFGEVQRKIAEKKRAQTKTNHPLLEIAFRVCMIKDSYERAPCKETGKIKECAVCPTSALEYQNYIQQIQLPLQPHPKSIAMEVAS